MGKLDHTMRYSISALALGVLTVGSLGAATAVFAPAAEAQSSKDFVDNYVAAKALIDVQQYSEALPKVEAASNYAKSSAEIHAVGGMKILVLSRLGNKEQLAKAIEAELALAGLADVQRKNYKAMLAVAYADMGQTEKALELTKELTAEGGNNSP